MKIYHGSSDRTIKKFELNNAKARTALDFGKGVYFTSKFEQARAWSCKYTETGAVYECDIDFSDLILQYNNTENDDLLYLLCFCRIGLEDIASEVAEGFDDADVIVGLMLDGTVKDFYRIAEQFIEGDLTFEELKEKTIIYDDQKRNQFCLKTKKAFELLNNGLSRVYFTEKRENTVVVAKVRELK